ncbi:hypothetical protein Tco_0257490 [Tanacetum coccineum]
MRGMRLCAEAEICIVLSLKSHGRLGMGGGKTPPVFHLGVRSGYNRGADLKAVDLTDNSIAMDLDEEPLRKEHDQGVMVGSRHGTEVSAIACMSAASEPPTTLRILVERRPDTMYTPSEAEGIATEQRNSDHKMLQALGITMSAPMAESLIYSVQNVSNLAAMSSFSISFMLVPLARNPLQSELQVNGKNELLH